MPPKGTGPRTVERGVELIDVFPTVLEWLGMEIPAEIQGHSLLVATQGGEAPPRRFVFFESGAVKALRGERYKLVYYPNQSYGELYDLLSDPHELTNLYASPEQQSVRHRMIQNLMDRLIHMEGSLHAESLRGPAYWRRLYRKQ